MKRGSPPAESRRFEVPSCSPTRFETPRGSRRLVLDGAQRSNRRSNPRRTAHLPPHGSDSRLPPTPASTSSFPPAACLRFGEARRTRPGSVRRSRRRVSATSTRSRARLGSSATPRTTPTPSMRRSSSTRPERPRSSPPATPMTCADSSDPSRPSSAQPSPSFGSDGATLRSGGAGFIAGAQGPNAHATIDGNSSPQNAPPCSPSRSIRTTSASALRSASAHRVALSRKNCSSLPATR